MSTEKEHISALAIGISEAMRNNDKESLIRILDEAKGSFAVLYVIQELNSKGNQHTPQSLWELLKNSK